MTHDVTIHYQLPGGDPASAVLRVTGDRATALRQMTAIRKEGLVVDSTGAAAAVAGDASFQPGHPVVGDPGFEMIPPHRITMLSLRFWPSG